MEAGGAAIARELQPTGRTVGEANSDWHIDNFASRSLGGLEILGPGVYDVTMRVKPGDGPVSFQWLWLQLEDGGLQAPAASSSHR